MTRLTWDMQIYDLADLGQWTGKFKTLTWDRWVYDLADLGQAGL